MEAYVLDTGDTDSALNQLGRRFARTLGGRDVAIFSSVQYYAKKSLFSRLEPNNKFLTDW